MFKITDFRGGYCDNTLNLNMPDNTFPEFTNVDFIEHGGFKVRNGCKKVNNEAYPDNVTQIIEWRLKDGVTKTIVIADKTMYVLSSVHGTYDPVKYNGENLVLKSDTVAYTFFKDYFYFTDGNKMYKWSDEVFYLHNLSCQNPYSFKKGDVIKLTVSKKESIFPGEDDIKIIDVRNKYPKKIRFLKNRNLQHGYEAYAEFNNLKYKYCSGVGYVYCMEATVSKTGDVDIEETCFVDDAGNYVPYYYTITDSFNDATISNPPIETVSFLYNFYGDREYSYLSIKPSFINIGTVDKYYKFNYDVDNFYPHNYNYNDNTQYYGKYTATDEDGKTASGSLLTALEDDNIKYNIRVVDVPADILNCKFFSYHPMSFRFFASGNSFDPTAVYYSELQDFETWQSKETAESTDLIFNKFYPRYNFGPLKGLITADNYVVGCYKDGFTTISGDVPEEYVFKNLSVPFGVDSTDSITLVPNGIVFYSKGYIYYMSNSLLGSDYVKVPSQAELYSLSENKLDNILYNSSEHKAVYFKNKYYLYFKDENNEPHILVYNFNTSSFLHYKDIYLECLIVKENLKLYCGSGKYIVSLFENGCHTDFIDGAEVPIRFKVKSKFYDFTNDFSSLIMNKLYLTTNFLDFSNHDFVYTKEIEDKETGEIKTVTVERRPNVSIILNNDCIATEKANCIDGSELWKNSIFNCVWCTNSCFNTSLYDVSFPFSRISFEISNGESSYLPLEFCVYDVSFEFSKGQNKNVHSYNNEKDDYILNYERR